MFRSENAGQILNNDRLDIEEQRPPFVSQGTHQQSGSFALRLTCCIDHTRVSTAPSPYVTTAALEDVKTSIQELRSILLARGGALGEQADELGADQRGRNSRRYGEIPGERNGDTASIGAIAPPPPTVVHTTELPRGSRTVRMHSPVTIVQPPRSRSRSSSRSRTYMDQPPGPIIHVAPPSPAQFVSGYSRRRLLSGATNATGRELESVISDFSSIVIIVCVFPNFSTLVNC